MIHVYFIGWMLIGLLKGIHLTYKDHKDGIDIDLKDLIVATLVSICAGPIIFLVFGINWDKVIIKGKKN